MDDRRNSSCPVATRLFRPEYKLQLPTHRELDSHSDRDRRLTYRIELSGSCKLLKQPALTPLTLLEHSVSWLSDVL